MSDFFNAVGVFIAAVWVLCSIVGISFVLIQNRKSELARQEAQREEDLLRQEAQHEEERRRQEVEARQRAAEQHASSQRSLSTRLISLVSDSTQSAATTCS